MDKPFGNITLRGERFHIVFTRVPYWVNDDGTVTKEAIITQLFNKVGRMIFRRISYV